MNTKIKSRSKCVFTIFLVGLLCGSTNYMRANHDDFLDDRVEEAKFRVQMKSSLRQVLAAISQAVSTLQGSGTTNDITTVVDALEAIEGATFDTTTDSLVNISNNTISVPFATSAQAGAIEGTGFTTANNSLYVITRQIALNQVISAGSNAAMSCTVVGATNAAAFNAAINTIFVDLDQALVAPTHTTITTLINDIGNAQVIDIAAGTITSPYSYQVITTGLQQLRVAATNWLSFYP